MQLVKNTILITGGAAGIGLALARALHEKGNRVLICGRSEERLAQAVSEVPGLVSFHCDISDAAQQDLLVTELQNNYPELNVLINNAGVQFNYQFTDLADHDRQIRQEVETNFTAALILTRKLLPTLISQPESAIINVTSGLAIVPKQSAAVYCATKAALRSFTQALRYQLEESTCRVFEIIPPLVDTGMTAGRGKGKISPSQLAREAMQGLQSDRQEILIGKSKLLVVLNRLAPALAKRILRYD